MAGKHHASRNVVCYTRTVHDAGGTNRLITFRTVVLHKKRLQPVASTAVGTLVALGITLALFGVNVGQPPTEPALVAITPTSVTRQPEQPVYEPPVLTPAPSPERLKPRVSIQVSRPLPTRVWPAVKAPVVDQKHGKHSSKDKDHDRDSG